MDLCASNGCTRREFGVSENLPAHDMLPELPALNREPQRARENEIVGKPGCIAPAWISFHRHLLPRSFGQPNCRSIFFIQSEPSHSRDSCEVLNPAAGSGSLHKRYPFRAFLGSGQGAATHKRSGKPMEDNPFGSGFARPGTTICFAAECLRGTGQRHLVHALRFESECDANSITRCEVHRRKRRSDRPSLHLQIQDALSALDPGRIQALCRKDH